MNKILTAVVSLLVGVLAFAVVGVGVTEALAPHVWPSAMIGLPVGIFAGTIAVPLTYLAFTYRRERRETGEASASTRRRLRTLVGASLGFIVVGGGAVALISAQAVGLATALIFVGLPIGLLAAVVGGYLAFRRDPSDRRPPGSTPQ